MNCNKNSLRSEAILFPCATCNLSCKYCTIDKSPALNQIDEALEKSFKGDYYFNRIQEYFPQRYQLQKLATWGGEPFLHMERIYETLHKLINYYPYFNSLFCSTNFSYPDWTDKVFDLFAQFGKYPYRNFFYQLQLSCDGPEEINDSGRGIGTTKKCLNNFTKFCKELYTRLPANVILDITVKPTLNVNSVKLLTTKEAVINYYKFFETTFIEPIKKLNYDNVRIYDIIPNTAVPAPITQEDGKNFALFCKHTYEIQKNIRKFLSYYEEVLPYKYSTFSEDWRGQQCQGCYCGSGQAMVGFLPNNYIATCDTGFTQLYDNYKTIAKNKSETISNDFVLLSDIFKCSENLLCLTDEEYKIYEEHLKYFAEPNVATVNNITNQIILTAMAGQIDSKYLDQQEATLAAQFLRRNCICVKDNYEVTNTISLIPIGLIRLLLNGALTYLLGD